MRIKYIIFNIRFKTNPNLGHSFIVIKILILDDIM